MEVILLRGAEEDLWSAWEHYEHIQPGLGDGFEAEVPVNTQQLWQEYTAERDVRPPRYL